MTDPETQVEELYRDAGPRILGYLARRCATPEDAADMFSDVVTVAWKRRRDLPAPPDDVLWLFGVAHNLLAADRRRVVRRSQVVLDLAENLRAQQHVPDHAEAVVLTHVIASLPDVDHEVLTLSVWEGLTAVEIGQVLAMPAVSVRSRLHRARARLRAQLAVDGGVANERSKDSPARR